MGLHPTAGPSLTKSFRPPSLHLFGHSQSPAPVAYTQAFTASKHSPILTSLPIKGLGRPTSRSEPPTSSPFLSNVKSVLGRQVFYFIPFSCFLFLSLPLNSSLTYSSAPTSRLGIQICAVYYQDEKLLYFSNILITHRNNQNKKSCINECH